MLTSARVVAEGGVMAATGGLVYGERIGGVDILFSDTATEHDGYNWKFSKNRSKRVIKKLFKRFGGYERRKPCMYRIAGRIVAHPSLAREIRKIGIGARQP